MGAVYKYLQDLHGHMFYNTEEQGQPLNIESFFTKNFICPEVLRPNFNLSLYRIYLYIQYT